MKKYLYLIFIGLLLTGCSQFAVISSGAGIAVTNNAYVKVYNGIDLATTIKTKKDIKTHAYHYVKATIEKSKEINEYIFETVNYPSIIVDEIPDGSVENKNIFKVDYQLLDAVNTHWNYPLNEWDDDIEKDTSLIIINQSGFNF
tara:strand:- start:51 stop:482 length:432 start_codon:yes stop_codon:yes gene_type:complete